MDGSIDVKREHVHERGLTDLNQNWCIIARSSGLRDSKVKI